MFFRILKKELKRKKGINVILFFFILLATIFVTSSVNNILVVQNATDYCMSQGKVPDDNLWISDKDSVEAMDSWMENEGRDYYTSYTKKEVIGLDKGNIKSFKGKEGTDYEIGNSIIIQNPWKDNLVVYRNNKQLSDMEDGTIGMQQREMDQNNLKKGDKITLKFQDYEKTFTVTDPVSDPSFGGEFIGETRYFVSQGDYEEIRKHTEGYIYLYNIDTDNLEQFSKQMNRQGFTIMVEINKSLFAFTYVMCLITSGVLIIVGVCLIIIAFLVLKFTISVTLQEDYKEIGIMKAIGIKDFGIKRLYLVKYFSLAAIAAILGFILSFPVSNGMIRMSASKMMMENSNVYFVVNILSSAVVLLVVLVFCYLSTNKLKKFSAMEAIRGGSTGERYRKVSKMSLHKKRGCRATVFMAVNDILSHMRRYVVMILTFMIGMVLIILCTNTIATFQSDGMAKCFLLDTDCEAYLQANKLTQENKKDVQKKEDIEEQLANMEQTFADKGYDAKVHTLGLIGVSVYAPGEEKDARSYVSMQPIGGDGSYIELVEGSTPKLENEVVVSEKILEKFNLKVGDNICIKLNGEEKTMIVSGSYQNYMQLGESIFLNEKIDAGNILETGCWFYQVDVKNAGDYEDVKASLDKDFDQYDFLDVTQAMATQLSDTITKIDMLKKLIVLLVCALNMLLTVLMMKIFVMGERGQIGMLRSVGFSVSALRFWQVFRMGITLVIGVGLGMILSIPVNQFAIKPIFGMMGATHMVISVNILESYILYPIILLFCVSIAAYVSSGMIKKMNIMEINNVE